MRARPGRVRSRREKSLSDSCRPWRCGRAAESARRLTFRPKYRQIIPRLAAPQSISSICIDVIDLADALAAFPKQTLLVCERLFFALASLRRLLTVQLHFVVHLRFRRKQFGREIERNSRFRFRLVKCEPLAQ